MMTLRKMIEKKNIKQKRSAWYTWTTKTVVPNKKLATKKKRRVVVLLEIVVIVVIFFVRCVMVCEYLVMMCFLIICFFSLLSSSVGLRRKKRPKIGSIAQKFSLEKTVGKHNKNFYGKNNIITR